MALLVGFMLWDQVSAARTDQVSPLTSAEWRGPDQPGELHWELLRLPERVVHLAVLPLRPLIVLTEEHQLHMRIYDLLTNDARTLILHPIIDVRGSEGAQGGLRLNHSNLLGGGEGLDLSGWVKANLDFALGASFSTPLSNYPGRGLHARVRYELDRDRGFVAVGGDSSLEQARALRSEAGELAVGVSWRDPAMWWLGFWLELSLMRESLRDERYGGVEASSFPGVDRTASFPELRLIVYSDTRDRPGRPTRGWLATLELLATHEIEDAQLSVVRADASLLHLIPVLRRARVLGLAAGLSAAAPWRSGQQIPLHAYPGLGRDRHLRGYLDRRFLDRYAWWGSAEYRWPLREYIDLDLMFSALVFVDVGRAGDGPESLFARAPRWSVGFGFLGDTSLRGLLRLLVGFSPEGVQLTLSLGGGP